MSVGTPVHLRWLGEPADLYAVAERRTGLSDWGGGEFRAGVEALMLAIRELPGLTLLGVLTFRSFITQSLVNRLLFVSGSHDGVPLQPPVIITGLPRSGTTFLHRLLSIDPALHAPPLWELLDPYAGGPPVLRRLRTRLQIWVKNRLLRDLDRKHFTRADTPEECTLLLANSFSSPLFWDMAPLAGYLSWYQSTPQHSAYQEYRRQLEILQARHPDRRLILKAPAHLGNLAALCEAVPEARLIQTHRDPTACFFSHCSLRETLSRLVVKRPCRSTIAGQVRSVFDHDLRANVEFHEMQRNHVTHVAYSDLQSRPMEVVKEIYRDIDLEWTAAADDRAARQLRSSPRHRFGKHRYSDLDWGISKERVDELFGAYRSRFAALLA